MWFNLVLKNVCHSWYAGFGLNHCAPYNRPMIRQRLCPKALISVIFSFPGDVIFPQLKWSYKMTFFEQKNDQRFNLCQAAK
ncbi:MAG: hypothetical protein C5B52_04620 [Bacteroidetes bacterium]|nr:MAG: hypothetical protein C5B52_04620 [Bacteroidota bacterium]